MIMQPSILGAFYILMMALYVGVIIFTVYCMLRFLGALDRGVAAHERIAEALSRRAGG
jgi:hypothetical protein